MRRGERIAADDLRAVRPGYGISPLDHEKILGLPLTMDLAKDSVLEWRHFK